MVVLHSFSAAGELHHHSGLLLLYRPPQGAQQPPLRRRPCPPHALRPTVPRRVLLSVAAATPAPAARPPLVRLLARLRPAAAADTLPHQPSSPHPRRWRAAAAIAAAPHGVASKGGAAGIRSSSAQSSRPSASQGCLAFEKGVVVGSACWRRRRRVAVLRRFVRSQGSRHCAILARVSGASEVLDERPVVLGCVYSGGGGARQP